MINTFVENFLVAAATAFTNAAHMLAVIIGLISIAYIVFPINSGLPLLNVLSIYAVYVLLRFISDFSYLQFLSLRRAINEFLNKRVDMFLDTVTA